MTNQNDYTDLTTLFDAVDLSCLYVARFSLFAPGILMATQQIRPAPHQGETRQSETSRPRHDELADALGDF